MGYAVELYFNREAEIELLRLRSALVAAGVPDILGQLGSRPHVSLAGFSSADQQALIEQTNVFAASIQSFELTLSHIGVFPTAEGVVFVGPTPTAHLLELHHAFHRLLSEAGIHPDDHYTPDRWVPHCTTAIDLTPAQMATAVGICVEAYRPVHAVCAEIGVISFRPVVSIATFPLHGTGG